MRHDRALIHQSQQMLLRVGKHRQILRGQRLARFAKLRHLLLVARFPRLRIVLVEGDDLLLHRRRRCAELLQCRTVGFHIRARLCHRFLAHRRQQSVRLRGEVQIERRGLVDIHRHRAVILDVELHDRVVVGIRRVILRVIIVDVERENRLHILLEQETVDRRRNARLVIREIIGIGIRLIALGQHAVGKAAHRFRGIGVLIGKITEHREHLRRGIRRRIAVELVCRKLEIDERQRLADPFRMDMVDHLPRADRPVKLRIGRTPFLRTVQTENDIIFGLVAGFLHRLRHRQHQTDGTVVVLEAEEVHIIMPADENLMVGGLALDLAHDVVGHARADLDLVVHNQRSGHGSFFHHRTQFQRIRYADGTGRDARRSANILTVERVVSDLRKAADVRRENRRRALILRLQHRIGDPPVIALVDID